MSLASSALPLLAGEQREGLRSDAVIFEIGSPLALAFRAEAVNLGLPARGIHDDITDLWYHYLDRQWSSAPGTLAGITLSTSLFCLETVARDYGMRVWFRADHNIGLDGRTSALVGEWARAFARFAAAVPLVDPGRFQQKTVEIEALPFEEPGPMVSWIIAPRGLCLRTPRNQSDSIS
jgi:hypothetical protein